MITPSQDLIPKEPGIYCFIPGPNGLDADNDPYFVDVWRDPSGELVMGGMASEYGVVVRKNASERWFGPITCEMILTKFFGEEWKGNQSTGHELKLATHSDTERLDALISGAVAIGKCINFDTGAVSTYAINTTNPPPYVAREIVRKEGRDAIDEAMRKNL